MDVDLSQFVFPVISLMAGIFSAYFLKRWWLAPLLSAGLFYIFHILYKFDLLIGYDSLRYIFIDAVILAFLSLLLSLFTMNLMKRTVVILTIASVILIIPSAYIMDHQKYTTYQEVMTDLLRNRSIADISLENTAEYDQWVENKDEEMIQGLLEEPTMELKEVNLFPCDKYWLNIKTEQYERIYVQVGKDIVRIQGQSYRILSNNELLTWIENGDFDWEARNID
ncbi:hypothetical protein [Ornithinibacillus contaminans]|uniref:hypothetical protein n=1 Tax=Ornithinibacillus contaminans TaxID=694055 RepID=UPI00064D9D81|nr:hypothetical protein [Ornithinibacillus contaminans]